jgi:hypothetical protein
MLFVSCAQLLVNRTTGRKLILKVVYASVVDKFLIFRDYVSLAENVDIVLAVSSPRDIYLPETFCDTALREIENSLY